jgi:lipocalin
MKFYFLTLMQPWNFLWIRSRKLVLDEAIYEKLVGRAQKYGFDTAKIIRVLQKEDY